MKHGLDGRCRLLVAVLAGVLAAPGCISGESRTRQGAEFNAKLMEQKLSTVRSGPFLVEAHFYQPSLLPLENLLARLAHGKLKTEWDSLNWSYVPGDVNNDAIAQLMTEGFLPALVRVTNTSDGPQPMQALILGAATPDRQAVAIPNEALPTELARFNWKNLVGNASGVVATVATVVAVAALFYVVAREARLSPAGRMALELMPNVKVGKDLQVGVGHGLCVDGVPVSYDGKPFTNEEARAFASACFKVATAVELPSYTVDRPLERVVELDYRQALLPSRLLAPGESVVGLQFFRANKPMHDWHRLGVTAEMAPFDASPLMGLAWPGDGAAITDAGWFRGDRGVRLELPAMPISDCGFDKENERIRLRFQDTYGESVLTQRLTITLGQAGLPEAGKTYQFDANDSNQQVELFLSKDMGELNSAWRSSVAGSQSSHCSFTVDEMRKVPRLVRELTADGKVRFHDRFMLAGRVQCGRVADWDFGKTGSWLKFDAAVACTGPIEPARVARRVEPDRQAPHDRGRL